MAREDEERAARATLGLDPEGNARIPPLYLAFFRPLMKEFPDDIQFKVDKKEKCIKCLKCHAVVTPPVGEGEDDEEFGMDIFGALESYREHITSPLHAMRVRFSQTPSPTKRALTKMDQSSPIRANYGLQLPATPASVKHHLLMTSPRDPGPVDIDSDSDIGDKKPFPKSPPVAPGSSARKRLRMESEDEQESASDSDEEKFSSSTNPSPIKPAFMRRKPARRIEDSPSTSSPANKAFEPKSSQSPSKPKSTAPHIPGGFFDREETPESDDDDDIVEIAKIYNAVKKEAKPEPVFQPIQYVPQIAPAPTQPAPPLMASASESFLLDAMRRIGNLAMTGPSSGRPVAPNPNAFDQYNPHTGGFSINYDSQAPITRLDVGHGDAVANIRSFVNDATKFNEDAPTIKEANDILNSPIHSKALLPLTIDLMPHQRIGVAWMLQNEDNKERRGGILADDMGLGKTVQMISLILANSPTSVAQKKLLAKAERAGKSTDDYAAGVKKERGPTLIVMPASLMLQWKDEFQKKVESGTLRVKVHHGSNKLASINEIMRCDVVITSFGTLNSDFSKGGRGKNHSNKKQRVSDGSARSASYEDSEEEETGKLLGQVEWHRVVIDEAQYIRNRSTISSQSVAKLKAKFRWCLTGTPVTNSLADIYGFLRFGKFKPFNDWNQFNEHIAKPQNKQPALAGSRAQAVLKTILLRRRKDMEVDGKPLINLPSKKKIALIELDFGPEERALYASIEESSKDKMIGLIQQGNVMKNYMGVLVMILRLRQLCCHPKLAKMEVTPRENSQTRMADRAAVVRLQQQDPGTYQKIQNMLATSASSNATPICGSCGDPLLEDARVTKCCHQFCGDCFTNHVAEFEDLPPITCPTCHQGIGSSAFYRRAAFTGELDAIDSSIEAASAKLKKAWDDGQELDLSTKFKYLVKMVQDLKRKFPGDKIIVYSQWTTHISLLQGALLKENIRSYRLDGQMKVTERNEELSKFGNHEGWALLFVSLKCGGVGLNLVAANRVFNMDLAWNMATESQAYDRVHRLGQLKDVFVERLVIKGTIEQRILELQDKKQGLADAALGEGNGNQLKKLSVKDLAGLFGITGQEVDFYRQ